MWMGEQRYYLDAKGRLVLPSAFRNGGERDALTRLVLTRGFENCIFAFSPESWNALSGKLSTLRMTDPSDRALARFFVGSATDCSLDRQGRLTIPEGLREHAGIEREVVVAGMGGRLEIWAKERWERTAAEAERTVQGSPKSFDL